MINNLDEAIKHCEEVAERQETNANSFENGDDFNKSLITNCLECAKEHRQLAEWLKELKESRIVLDILGQFLADTGIDVCCEDLLMIDDYCEKHCDNQKPLCWYRWAKMKPRYGKSTHIRQSQ
jgi:uncharacterized protein Yka (UPF0111/DUF47 family)